MIKIDIKLLRPFLCSCEELAAILGHVDSQVCQASSQDAPVSSKTPSLTGQQSLELVSEIVLNTFWETLQ